MFNPIFKETVQGRKHLGSCIIAVPTLHNFRKPKIVKLVKWTHKKPYPPPPPQKKKKKKKKNSRIDCDGVQLTDAQWSHGTYIHIMLEIIVNYTNDFKELGIRTRTDDQHQNNPHKSKQKQSFGVY